MLHWYDKLGIRKKLTVVSTLTIMIVLGLLTIINLARNSHHFEKSSKEQLASLAEVIAASLEASLLFDDKERAISTLATLSERETTESAQLYTQKGDLFASYSRTNTVPELTLESARQNQSQDLVVISRPVGGDEKLGTLIIADSREPLEQYQDKSLLIAGILLFWATLMSMLLFRLVQRPITNRLSQLSEDVERIGKTGNYEVSLQSRQTEDEIGALIKGFNKMVGEIRKREDDLRDANSQLENRVRERTSELKEMAERAQAANQAKSEFLAVMSHELRTPLVPIISLSQMLMETQAELEEAERESLGIIRDSGRNLSKLIEDILDISRVEAGRINVELSTFGLPAFIDKTIEMLNFRRNEGVELIATMEDGLPDNIHSDSKRLQQIILNVVGNALKFTHEGSVRLDVSRQKSESGEEQLFFVARDTGIGIPDDKLRIIFDPFKQVDSTSTREYGGAGLGLAIARRMCRLLGGDISCESTLGKGSTFRFWVALKTSQPVLEPTATSPSRPDKEETGSTRILVADDDPANRHTVEMLLNRVGYDCDLVESGRGAIEALEQNDYDLVLMDVRMPDMDGTVTTAKIREGGGLLESRKHIVIIAFTANAMKGDMERYLAAGMDDYLSKPFNPEELYSILSRHLKGRVPG